MIADACWFVKHGGFVAMDFGARAFGERVN